MQSIVKSLSFTLYSPIYICSVMAINVFYLWNTLALLRTFFSKREKSTSVGVKSISWKKRSSNIAIETVAQKRRISGTGATHPSANPKKLVNDVTLMDGPTSLNTRPRRSDLLRLLISAKRVNPIQELTSRNASSTPTITFQNAAVKLSERSRDISVATVFASKSMLQNDKCSGDNNENFTKKHVCVRDLEGVHGVQNVPRSAWVKTDVASVCVSTDIAFAVLLAAPVFTHALRGKFCTLLPTPGAHL
jgi:hypothetical protein